VSAFHAAAIYESHKCAQKIAQDEFRAKDSFAQRDGLFADRYYQFG
jgi:hypothetical protein